MNGGVDRPSSHFRLFFAFDLSDDIRAEAKRTQAVLQGRLERRGVRWTDPSDMHITALFLGNHANERLSGFAAAATDAVAAIRSFHFTVGGIGRFPNAGPPRVLWIGVREPDHAPASQIIASLRSHFPDIPTDHPSYRPHITVGYVQPTASPASVESALEAVENNASMSMIVDRLVLMQTIPRQQRRKSPSARYNIVQVFPFPM